jgi:hypothetical protein
MSTATIGFGVVQNTGRFAPLLNGGPLNNVYIEEDLGCPRNGWCACGSDCRHAEGSSCGGGDAGFLAQSQVGTLTGYLENCSVTGCPAIAH